MSYTSKNQKLDAFQNKSLLQLSHLSEDAINNLFSVAKSLQEESRSYPGGDFSKILGPIKKGVAALLFFENSTRTRMSFESATQKVGLGTVLLDSHSGSSLHKGETAEDTIYNVAAMDPQVLVIRCGNQLDLNQISKNISVPIINAGWGSQGHPTQTLLDLFTIWRERNLKGTRLMIVGDILHSRVASSHFEIFDKLNIEVAGCGPEVFKPKATHPNLKWFNSVDEGLEWCHVVMALRVQNERHSSDVAFSSEIYKTQFGINNKRMLKLQPEGLLLHPGPVNWGVELDKEILADQRVRILQQVNNGLYLRMALLKLILS